MEPIMTTQQSAAHPALSWRSVLAGLVLSLFAFVTLLALGIAVGGFGLEDGATMQNTGIYSGVWVTLAAAISLFAASYFASRITPYISSKVGMGQGAVIAAVFFGFIMWQAGGIIGGVTRGASSLVGQAASAAPALSSLSQSDTVNILAEDAMADLELKADPATVSAGLAGRLLRGNTEGAKTYLARQSNLTEGEIETRIADLNAQMQGALTTARENGAQAMKVAGLSLFVMMVLGIAASAIGGQLGMRTNRKEPLVAANTQTTRFEPVYT